MGGRFFENGGKRGQELHEDRHRDFEHRNGHGAPFVSKTANLPIFAPTMNGLLMLERSGWAHADTAILAVVDARLTENYELFTLRQVIDA
jgi:hypothetical protein